MSAKLLACLALCCIVMPLVLAQCPPFAQLGSTKGSFSVALTSNGSVWTWGSSLSGGPQRNLPGAMNHSGILSGKKISQVASGFAFSVALATDGSLISWGDNSAGQLGDGTAIQTSNPVSVNQSGVLNGKTILQITAGDTFAIALANGSLFSWGDNSVGQLGDGTAIQRLYPVSVNQSGVMSGKIISQIAAGYTHSIALANGSLFSWGDNGAGQLGDGTVIQRLNPVSVNQSGVMSGKIISQIDAGRYHTIALATDGSLFSWGDNSYGQLGNGANPQTPIPVMVDMTGILRGKNISKISCGEMFTVVLTTDNILVSWGQNYEGQLGDGTTTSQNRPVAVNMNGVLMGAIIARIAVHKSHTIVLASDGSCYAWGGNLNTQLGNGVVLQETRPSMIQKGALNGKNISQIAAGSSNSAALSTDGMVFTWGDNQSGELGDNTTLPHPTPVAVILNGKNISQISIQTSGTTVALATNGSVYSCGYNNYGNFGDGTYLQSSLLIAANLSKSVSKMGTGHSHTIVLTTDGSILAWGSNNYGEIGDGTQGGYRYSPVSVNMSAFLLRSIRSVDCGFFHSIALAYDGTVFCWGQNNHGQLGDGTTNNQYSPVSVNKSGVLSGAIISEISAGFYHNIVLTTDGKLYAWGYSVGIGSGTGDQLVPVPVDFAAMSGKNITQISLGQDHSLALASDGSVFAWGNNLRGQIGDGTTEPAFTPVLVNISGKKITQIAAGSMYSLVLANDGSMFGWGQNWNGQIGNGILGMETLPVKVCNPDPTPCFTGVFDFTTNTCEYTDTTAFLKGEVSGDIAVQNSVVVVVGDASVLGNVSLDLSVLSFVFNLTSRPLLSSSGTISLKNVTLIINISRSAITGSKHFTLINSTDINTDSVEFSVNFDSPQNCDKTITTNTSVSKTRIELVLDVQNTCSGIDVIVVGASTAAAVVVVIIVSTVGFCYFKRRKKAERSSLHAVPLSEVATSLQK